MANGKSAQWTIRSVNKLSQQKKTAVLEFSSEQSWSTEDIAEAFAHMAREIRAGTYNQVLAEAFGTIEAKMAGGAFSLEEIELAKSIIEGNKAMIEGK